MALDKATGKYGAVNFVVGAPTAPKPVRGGVCWKCGHLAYRETFSVGKGWRWEHTACDETKVFLERRYTTRGMHPIGYVPKEYTRSQPGPSPAEAEGFKPR